MLIVSATQEAEAEGVLEPSLGNIPKLNFLKKERKSYRAEKEYYLPWGLILR